MAIGKKSPFKLFGHRRRQEQEDATADFQDQMKSYKNLNVGKNTYKG